MRLLGKLYAGFDYVSDEFVFGVGFGIGGSTDYTTLFCFVGPCCFRLYWKDDA